MDALKYYFLGKHLLAWNIYRRPKRHVIQRMLHVYGVESERMLENRSRSLLPITGGHCLLKLGSIYSIVTVDELN